MPQEVTMNPNRWRAGPTATLTAGMAAVALAACGGSQPAAASTPRPAATVTATPTAAAAAQPAAGAVATNAVDIANFAFSPAVITVRSGTTVTWTNKDEDAHTVAIAGASVSQPLQVDETYTHAFVQPGTYSYLCTIHPNMRGTVVVTVG